MRRLTDEEELILRDYARFSRSRDHSTTTVKARVRFARARIRDWGVEGFTERNIRDFFADTKERIADRHGDKRKVWTPSVYHGHLSDFCAWAFLAGLIDYDPMPAIERPRNPKSAPKPLSESQVDRVLAAAVGEVRDYMILAAFAGLRVSEIARVRGEDFEDESLLVTGKGGDVERLPLHPLVAEMRDRYPASGYWFQGRDQGHVVSSYISRDVGKVFRECGIDSGSAHRLRHSFATYLLRQGASIRTVQRLMRHANLETTAGYTAVADDELSAAVNLLTYGRGAGSGTGVA